MVDNETQKEEETPTETKNEDLIKPIEKFPEQGDWSNKLTTEGIEEIKPIDFKKGAITDKIGGLFSGFTGLMGEKAKDVKEGLGEFKQYGSRSNAPSKENPFNDYKMTHNGKPIRNPMKYNDYVWVGRIPGRNNKDKRYDIRDQKGNLAYYIINNQGKKGLREYSAYAIDPKTKEEKPFHYMRNENGTEMDMDKVFSDTQEKYLEYAGQNKWDTSNLMEPNAKFKGGAPAHPGSYVVMANGKKGKNQRNKNNLFSADFVDDKGKQWSKHDLIGKDGKPKCCVIVKGNKYRMFKTNPDGSLGEEMNPNKDKNGRNVGWDIQKGGIDEAVKEVYAEYSLPMGENSDLDDPLSVDYSNPELPETLGQKQRRLEMEEKAKNWETMKPRIAFTLGLGTANILSQLPNALDTHMRATHRLFNAFLSPNPMSMASQSLVAVAAGVAEGEKVLHNINQTYGIKDPNNPYSKGLLAGTIMGGKYYSDMAKAKEGLATLAASFDGVLAKHKVDFTTMDWDEWEKIAHEFEDGILRPQLNELVAMEKQDKLLEKHGHLGKMTIADKAKLEALRYTDDLIRKKKRELKNDDEYQTNKLIQKYTDELDKEFDITSVDYRDPGAATELNLKFDAMEAKYRDKLNQLTMAERTGVHLSRDQRARKAAIENWLNNKRKYRSNAELWKDYLKEEEDRRVTAESEAQIELYRNFIINPMMTNPTLNSLEKLDLLDELLAVDLNGINDRINHLRQRKANDTINYSERVELAKWEGIKKMIESHQKDLKLRKQEDTRAIGDKIYNFLAIMDPYGNPKNLSDLSIEELKEVQDTFYNKPFDDEGNTLYDLYTDIGSVAPINRTYEDAALFSIISTFYTSNEKALTKARKLARKKEIEDINDDYNKKYGPDSDNDNGHMDKDAVWYDSDKNPIYIWNDVDKIGNENYQNWIISSIVQKANTDAPIRMGMIVDALDINDKPTGFIMPANSRLAAQLATGIANRVNTLSQVIRNTDEHDPALERLKREKEYLQDWGAQINYSLKLRKANHLYARMPLAPAYKKFRESANVNDKTADLFGIFGVSVSNTNIPRISEIIDQRQRLRKSQGGEYDDAIIDKIDAGDRILRYDCRVISQGYRYGLNLLNRLGKLDPEHYTTVGAYDDALQFLVKQALLVDDIEGDNAYLEGKISYEEAMNDPEKKETRERLWDYIYGLEIRLKELGEEVKSELMSPDDFAKKASAEEEKAEKERKKGKKRGSSGPLPEIYDIPRDDWTEREYGIEEHLLVANPDKKVADEPSYIYLFNTANALNGEMNSFTFEMAYNHLSESEQESLIDNLRQYTRPHHFQSKKIRDGGWKEISTLIEKGINAAKADTSLSDEEKKNIRAAPTFIKGLEGSFAEYHKAGKGYYEYERIKKEKSKPEYDDYVIRTCDGGWSAIAPTGILDGKGDIDGYDLEAMGLFKDGKRIAIRDVEDLDVGLTMGLLPRHYIESFDPHDLREDLGVAMGIWDKAELEQVLSDRVEGGTYAFQDMFERGRMQFGMLINKAKAQGLDTRELEKIYNLSTTDMSNPRQIGNIAMRLERGLDLLEKTAEASTKADLTKESDALGDVWRSNSDDPSASPKDMGLLYFGFALANHDMLREQAFPEKWADDEKKDASTRKETFVKNLKDLKIDEFDKKSPREKVEILANIKPIIDDLTSGKITIMGITAKDIKGVKKMLDTHLKSGSTLTEIKNGFDKHWGKYDSTGDLHRCSYDNFINTISTERTDDILRDIESAGYTSSTIASLRNKITWAKQIDIAFNNGKNIKKLDTLYKNLGRTRYGEDEHTRVARKMERTHKKGGLDTFEEQTVNHSLKKLKGLSMSGMDDLLDAAKTDPIKAGEAWDKLYKKNMESPEYKGLDEFEKRAKFMRFMVDSCAGNPKLEDVILNKASEMAVAYVAGRYLIARGSVDPMTMISEIDDYDVLASDKDVKKDIIKKHGFDVSGFDRKKASIDSKYALNWIDNRAEELTWSLVGPYKEYNHEIYEKTHLAIRDALAKVIYATG